MAGFKVDLDAVAQRWSSLVAKRDTSPVRTMREPGVTALAQAAEIHRDVHRFGASIDRTLLILSKATPEERVQIDAAYHHQYGRSLAQDLEGNAGKGQIAEAMGLLSVCTTR